MEGENEEKFCGNCDSHNCYEYPIVETLWHCDSYNRVSQECYCVREASKQKNNAGNAAES
jgi:hypothetical protein